MLYVYDHIIPDRRQGARRSYLRSQLIPSLLNPCRHRGRAHVFPSFDPTIGLLSSFFNTYIAFLNQAEIVIFDLFVINLSTLLR